MNEQNQQLDPTVVNFARSIKRVENPGGDPNQKGGSGEWGDYQYTKATWDADTKKYGLNYQFGTATREQQNEVAYKKFSDLKKQGYTPAQIASIHNSGKPEWQGNVGVNKFGVKYDTPKYVDSVMKAYEEIKGGNMNPAITPTASTAQPEKKEGFIESLAKSVISPVATMVARPIQAGAELLGASAEDVNKVTKDIAGDWVAPVPQGIKDVVKDIGRGAETVALGLPIKGVGGAVKVGALAGAGSGLEQEGTLGGAVKGATVGAGTGLVAGGISKLLQALPKRLASDAFKGLSDAEIEQVMKTKSIGSMSSIQSQSEKALSAGRNQVKNLISEAEKAGAVGSGNDALRKTILQFPEYNTGSTVARRLSGKNTGAEQVLNKIKSLISSSATENRSAIISAIDKIADGTATLTEKDMVRSAIDRATKGGYAKLAKALQPSAGHDLAMEFANNLRGEVQAWVPGTQPIFDDMAREMNILGAVRKLAGKQKGGLIRWSDIVPFMAGSGLGGLPGGLAATAVNRLAGSPATEFGIAKSVEKLSKVSRPVLNRAGLLTGLSKEGK